MTAPKLYSKCDALAGNTRATDDDVRNHVLVRDMRANIAMLTGQGSVQIDEEPTELFVNCPRGGGWLDPQRLLRDGRLTRPRTRATAEVLTHPVGRRIHAELQDARAALEAAVAAAGTADAAAGTADAAAGTADAAAAVDDLAEAAAAVEDLAEAAAAVDDDSRDDSKDDSVGLDLSESRDPSTSLLQAYGVSRLTEPSSLTFDDVCRKGYETKYQTSKVRYRNLCHLPDPSVREEDRQALCFAPVQSHSGTTEDLFRACERASGGRDFFFGRTRRKQFFSVDEYRDDPLSKDEKPFAEGICLAYETSLADLAKEDFMDKDGFFNQFYAEDARLCVRKTGNDADDPLADDSSTDDSSADDSPTGALAPDPAVPPPPSVEWVLADAAGSCDAVCSRRDRACDAEALAALDDSATHEAQLLAAYEAAGHTCRNGSIARHCEPDNCPRWGAPYVHSSHVADGLCWGGMATAACDQTPVDGHHRRLCPCK